MIFLENDGGCFVTKLSPDGSASRSGAVQVGDQLVSINGTSGHKMKVDDICDVISSSPDPTSLALTFVRYVGRLSSIKLVSSASESDLDVDNSDVIVVEQNDSTPRRNKGPSREGSTTRKKNFRWFSKGKKRLFSAKTR